MRTPHSTPSCGVGSALGVGLSAIIGGSLFATMGPALLGAGSGAPIAYFLGALPAYITAYSYVRMSAAHPGTGGTMAYFNLAYGGGLLSAGLNLLLVVCYAAVAALYAGVFGAYVADIFHLHSHTVQRVMSCTGIALVAVMNLSRAAISRRVQLPLNAGKFLIMGIFLAMAAFSPLWNRDNFSERYLASAPDLVTTGLTIFMSYQGFELLAAIRRPFRSPRRTLPIAMALCLGIVTLYYCGIAYCTVGNVDFATVPEQSSYMLSAVARRILGEGGSLLLCVGAVVAAASAMNADVFSVSMIPEEMAKERELPPYFLPTHAGARTQGIIFLCTLLVLFVNLLSIRELTAISSLGFLCIYTLANAAALKITAPTRTARLLHIGGVIACGASVVIVAHSLFFGPDSLLLIAITSCMLALPFTWQAVYYYVRHRRRR